IVLGISKPAFRVFLPPPVFKDTSGLFWCPSGGAPAPAARNGSRGLRCYPKSHPHFHAGSCNCPAEEARPGFPLAMSANSMSDPRRPNKVLRYKPPPSECNPALDDPTPDYMNLLGMIFSMCGLMLKLKWCAWVAVYCSFISFANSRSSEDTKQMMSSFMLSISAVVMSYLQNPQPMTPPW
uniref:PAT complex subunit Asterix n=12 Tax=Eutheria TaxID=9347 RepID=G3UA66_LOXAF